MRVGDCFEGISDLPENQSHCRRCEFLSNKEWGDLTDLPRMQPRNLKWHPGHVAENRGFYCVPGLIVVIYPCFYLYL